jgi:hypothetical protein
MTIRYMLITLSTERQPLGRGFLTLSKHMTSGHEP